MQIPSNPAAITHAALANQRSAPAGTLRTSSNSIVQLEQSTKSGDRDAQERYQGPEAQRPNPSNVASEPATEELVNWTQLPAEDGETHQLDISG
jgi:hypothetical protein